MKLFLNSPKRKTLYNALLQLRNYDAKGVIYVLSDSTFLNEDVFSLNKSGKVVLIDVNTIAHGRGKCNTAKLMEYTSKMKRGDIFVVDNLMKVLSFTDKGNCRLMNSLMHLFNLENPVIISYDYREVGNEMQNNIDRLYKNGFGMGNEIIPTLSSNSDTIGFEFVEFGAPLRPIRFEKGAIGNYYLVIQAYRSQLEDMADKISQAIALRDEVGKLSSFERMTWESATPYLKSVCPVFLKGLKTLSKDYNFSLEEFVSLVMEAKCKNSSICSKLSDAVFNSVSGTSTEYMQNSTQNGNRVEVKRSYSHISDDIKNLIYDFKRNKNNSISR